MRDRKKGVGSQSSLDEKKLGHLYRRLIVMRQEGQEETRRLLDKMTRLEQSAADQASCKRQYELNERQYNHCKERLGKIDAALLRIVQGGYGYCLETGRPISPSRLMANPLVELCGAAQRRREKWEHLKGAA